MKIILPRKEIISWTRIIINTVLTKKQTLAYTQSKLNSIPNYDYYNVFSKSKNYYKHILFKMRKSKYKQMVNIFEKENNQLDLIPCAQLRP